MLMIRMNKGGALKLGRKVAESGGYGVWEFHCSENTFTRDHGHTAYRHARIKPADPAEGKPVEVTLMNSATAPEEKWIPYGEGTASIHPGY